MGELDRKDKSKQDAEQRKRRADVDDQDGAGDGTNLMPWDHDVDEFMERLERALNDMRTPMTSTEFRALCVGHRELSKMEKRTVANRLQKRGLANLLRALHANDFRMYTDGWETESRAMRATNEGATSDEP